mmetsp:Transcript_3391/g.6360  ORF Transcript_3391/g.6360 Transcript_3391/m.6360 type:complete len:201 (-) Transcript_3391:657-1259(-)
MNFHLKLFLTFFSPSSHSTRTMPMSASGSRSSSRTGPTSLPLTWDVYIVAAYFAAVTLFVQNFSATWLRLLKPHDSFRVRWEQSALSSVIEFSDLNLVQAIWAYAAWQERMGKELHILIWGIITERLDRLGIVCMLTLLRALTIYRHFGLSHRFESAIGEAGECLFFRLKRNRSRWRLRGVLTGFHRARNSQDAQDDPYH